MRRYLPPLVLLLTLPLLYGCPKDCRSLRELLALAQASGEPAAIEAAEQAIAAAGGCPLPPTPPEPPPKPDPDPTPTPTPSPGPTTTPEPTPEPIPSPTPAPELEPPLSIEDCPKALAPGAEVYLRDAKRYAGGSGLDVSFAVRGDPELCRLIHGVAVNDCHLEGWKNRDRCERFLADGCPTWRYKTGPAGVEGRCSDDQRSAPISCDHFGDPTFRDDPQTHDVFEGRPAACGLQRDEFGPAAGFFMVPHGGGTQVWVQACMPDGTRCSGWQRATWRE